MALISALVLGLVFFEGTARWLIILAGLLVELTEATFMFRMSRRKRPAVGPEALIGRVAVAAGACAPDGQVRIDGEIWQARCAAGCHAGQLVRIVAVDGLTLTVEPVSREH